MFRWNTLRSVLMICALLLGARAAMAALTIEIVGGASNQIPVSVVPFASDNGVAPVIDADLRRSGFFRMIPAPGSSPADLSQVAYADWTNRGANAIVIGSVTPRGDGRFDVRFRLLDITRQAELAAMSYTVSSGQLRATAHKIADIVYEKLTGHPGIFSTRISYVVQRGKQYELQVADADGFGEQTVLTSREPIISPAWSPDGTRVAYVSFEQRRPVVYVQSLSTGQRRAVASHPGNNSAPAWSEDGSRLAVVLSKDGNSEIYSMNADGGNLQRLTNNAAIDTEPTWSPDGKYILFTSDRSGSPQIYRMPASGGEAARVTFTGDYNVSADFSPDGKSFVFIHRSGGRFRIARHDLSNGQMEILTEAALDESPSYAPNGQMVLYASKEGRNGVLSAVSADGRVKQKLSTRVGEVREPAWGPLPR